MSSVHPPHRALRSVLGWVLEVVRGDLLDDSVAIPTVIKRQAGQREFPTAALGAVRRAIESDEVFRSALVERLGREEAGATRVDPIGRVWLLRPDDWRLRIDELMAAEDLRRQIESLRVELRREERKRSAAEEKLARARTERASAERAVRHQDSSARDVRRELEHERGLVESLRAEIAELRMAARHGEDRLKAATQRERSERERAEALQAELARIQSVRDQALADRATASADRAELEALCAAASDLARRLGSLIEVPEPLHDAAVESAQRPGRRRALALPGGVVSDSLAAAEYLLRSGAAVLIDGYNVSMSAWSNEPIDRQRDLLIGVLEGAASRFGSEMIVVFDGAAVVGASRRGRRLIRVMFSPEGVIADDVIRAEVRRIDPRRPVVVVTNDVALVRSTRSMGANTLSSDRFLATVR